MGLTPHSEANAASDWKAFRVTPGSDQEVGRRVGSYAEDTDQGWRGRPGESIELGLQVADLLAELTVAAGKGAQSVPGRCQGTVQTTGTEALATRDQGTGSETIERFAKLGRGRDNQSLHLVDGLGASLDGRVLRTLEHTDHLDFALA